jgi:DNA-binding MarR family transcriptional regulator
VKTNAEFAECIDCSCLAARRTARTLTRHYEQILKPTGLTVTQFGLLAMLSLGGPQPLSRFAGLLGVERTTLTRNLRPLQDRGWVTDSASGDRRVRLLAITKRGTAAAREALPYWRDAQKSIARRLGAGAIQALATASQAAAESSPKRG